MNKNTKPNQTITALLDMLLHSFPKEEREGFVSDGAFLSRVLWLNFKSALHRIESADHICLYNDGNKGKNLYAEGFFDGMAAGLKVSGVDLIDMLDNMEGARK
jgi:hypothetical protein